MRFNPPNKLTGTVKGIPVIATIDYTASMLVGINVHLPQKAEIINAFNKNIINEIKDEIIHKWQHAFAKHSPLNQFKDKNFQLVIPKSYPVLTPFIEYKENINGNEILFTISYVKNTFVQQNTPIGTTVQSVKTKIKQTLPQVRSFLKTLPPSTVSITPLLGQNKFKCYMEKTDEILTVKTLESINELNQSL